MAMTLAALVAAIVLTGSSVTPAQAASGYETEPVLNAKDLVGPELLKGPHFTVDAKVPVTGFIARFTVRSSFGTFEAHGLRMLPITVNEVEALAKLDELSKTREFLAAAGRAIARPVVAAANMVTRPVETVRGVPGGVSRLFGRIGLAGRRIGQAATAPDQNVLERTGGTFRAIGSTAAMALGFEAERRRLAERLGVDPYTTNLLLSEKLTDVAWVSFSGRLGIAVASAILVPYSQAMAGVSATNRAIWDTPAGDLINNANATFGRTGASTEQVQALMRNTQYSLSSLTALAFGIQRLEGVTGRDALVVFAAVAETQDEVHFAASAVNMLARYHEAVSPLSRVSAPGPILAHSAAGVLVLPMPVDYVSWIEPLGRTVVLPELQAPDKLMFLSGRTSRLARTNLVSRGWRIDELNSNAAER